MRSPGLATAMGLSPEASRRRDELVLQAYAFAGALTRTTGERDLNELIVRTMAQTVSAEQGALAVYDQREQVLTLGATYGYQAVLVEHLRIEPGTGVIGTVFTSRNPLLVTDVARQLIHQRRRLRYRTPSFIAVPLPVGGDVLGVLTLADRGDGQPFDDSDLVAVQVLAAPAALALDRQRLQKRQRELEQLAAADPLTGLSNRRYFQTRLAEEIERAHRYSVDLSLFIVDIDDFKALNDSLGHLVGDEVVRKVADLLRRSVRVFDVCARYGGDEFAILVPGSGSVSATQNAERIRARIEAFEPAGSTLLPPSLRVTVSIGLGVLTAGVSSHELFAHADRALYRAKASGKNCVRLAGV